MKQHHSFVILFLLAANILAAEPVCKITDFGIFENAQPVLIKDEPGAATGQMAIYTPSSIIERTVNVQAKIGTRFGVKHVFTGITPEAELIAIVSHPAIISPSGEKKSQSRTVISSKSSESAYSFDRESELLAGVWSFRFEFSGKTLCKKTFTVSKN